MCELPQLTPFESVSIASYSPPCWVIGQNFVVVFVYAEQHMVLLQKFVLSQKTDGIRARWTALRTSIYLAMPVLCAEMGVQRAEL